MKKRVQLIPIALITVVLLLGLFGCSQNQDRYEDPSWLGGTSIETLKGRVNYSVFLSLMDKAGKTFTVENTLTTLFVPKDSVFVSYFKAPDVQSALDSVAKMSYIDVDGNVNNEKAARLFALHFLPNGRSADQLIYEYAFEELQTQKVEYASSLLRKRTGSVSAPYRETIPADYEDSKLAGQTVTIKTGSKLMPLWSGNYFGDFFGDASGLDYDFMYPESKWNQKTKLAWGNAAVVEREVRTANGFIYFIDQVVSNQISIEEYLLEQKKAGKNHLYYDVLQKFADYSPVVVNKKPAYNKQYRDISNIAEDLGPSTDVNQSMRLLFTVFLPTDQALGDYWMKTFGRPFSADDTLVNKMTLKFIAQTHISNTLGLISKISKNFFNAYGDFLTIQESDINKANNRFCSNGVVYEMNKVLEPNMFTCVPGKLFFNPNYSVFLAALDASGLMNVLANQDLKFTIFAADNENMEKAGIRYDKDNSKIKYRGNDGQWTNIKDQELSFLIQDNIYKGIIEDLNTDRYIQMWSNNYIHISNGKIQSGLNMRKNNYASVKETHPNDRNGILYYIDTPIQSKVPMGNYLANDTTVSTFYQMLKVAGLVKMTPEQPSKDEIYNISFLSDADDWTAFIPTNEAMAEGKVAGLVPDFKKDKDGAKRFLLYHFVRKNTIFNDGNPLGTGTFDTNRAIVTPLGTEYSTVKINNASDDFSIEDHSGQIIKIPASDADFLVRKGVVHKINTILNYGK